MTISLYDTVENTVGKGENAGRQHFFHFQHCFQKPFSLGSLKLELWGKEKDTLFPCKITAQGDLVIYLKNAKNNRFVS